LAGSYDTPGVAKGVFVSGDHAFVADGTAGLQVIDITNTAVPTLAGSYDTPGFSHRVGVSGDLAFVADQSALLAIDVSNPAVPTLAGTYVMPLQTGAWDVYIAGDYAYVASGGLAGGLHVIDIADPSSPSLAGSYDTPDQALGVHVSGNYAFVADGDDGELLVIDISDPSSPTPTASHITPGSAQGVHVAGDLAFVADYTSGLRVIQVFQGEVYPDSNEARSLLVGSESDTVVSARLTATQTDDITWELSADGGANWQVFGHDGTFGEFSFPGTNLFWRSTLVWETSGDAPVASDLTIAWFFENGVVESVADIGYDQGRQVRVEWTRSGSDFVGATPQVTEYAVYRKHDPAAPSPASDIPIRAPAIDGWDYVLTVPADAEDYYAVLVPTLKDSTIAEGMHYSTFFVRARMATPGVHFDSAPDSGYSVDNLEPHVPSGLVVAYNTGNGNQLSWEPCPDEDFNVFRVYRSNDPDFTPAPENLADETTGTEWQDPVHGGGDVHYKITAVDLSGNESDATGPGSATGVTEIEIPRSFALHQNVPNPFNPTTTIAFDLPERANVKLAIFDVSGRLVRMLVDTDMSPGHKSISWNGKDTAGRKAASGVYFYRLETPSFEQSKKMILLQ